MADPLDALFQQPAQGGDPLDNMWADDRRKQAGLTLVPAARLNPDQAGQANGLARETGLPADTVQRNLPQVQAQQRAQQAQTIFGKYPLIADWSTNPRNAAVAHDDMGVLARVGDGVVSTAKAIGGALLSWVPQTAEGIYGTAQALFENDPGIMVQKALGIPLPRNPAADRTERFLAARRQDAQAYTKSLMPDTGNWVTNSLLSGVSNVPQTAAALGLSFAGAPEAGLGLMGVTQGGQSYGQARDQGVSPGKAASFAVSQGAIEVATEKMPLDYLVHSLGKVGLPKFLAGFLGREVASEEVATIGQDLNDWAVLHPGQSLADYAKEHASDIPGTALGVLATGGAAGALHLGLQIAHGRAQADASQAGAAMVDNLMAQAAKSKTRERDGQAFRDLVAAHAEGTPVENIHVPGEKLREFFQSDRFDPDDASHQWLGGYADQANEASALGGDVVIPLADAATHLAGTPLWETLKDDVRVTPGGLSPREAKEYAASHADAMEQLGKQAADAFQADQEARAPVQKVFDDVAEKLRLSGMAPDAADQLAQLYAAHAQVWGARLGTDALAYHEQTAPEFRQILPPALAKVQAADQTDILINALKRGAESPSAGPSLLEFIAKAGGVEDKGGDIRSMGGDKWHREKAFRKRLIREGVNQEEALPGMGGGIGAATGYGLDDVAHRAWEAGYFPDMHDRPTTNDLLDAIGKELRGSPVHAQAQVEQQAHMADAVEELRAILDQRGLDPEKATRESIRQELQRYEQEQRGGRGYEQTYNEGVRGRATFGSGKPIIELFQSADLSTLIHETGHVWLEELRTIAEREDAPADVKADWQSVQDWFAANGHAMQDGMIPTEAHELWARGFERFAMEGKAPSSALRRAFDAFRSWLLHIYKVVDNLRAPITPEIRDVMNRMLATQEEIDQAEEAQNLKALFTDAAQAGMTEEEFAAYQASTQDAKNEAYDALIYKTMHAIRKARTKEWKADEAVVRADVTDRINKRPEFRALHLLRTGKWLGEPDREGMKVRLDRAELVGNYGNEALSMLPNGVPPIYADKGTSADAIAELVGFRTGDEMVRTLMGLETAQKAMREAGDKRSIRQRLVDEETAQEMRDRFGDPLNDGSIEEEALAAVHNDRQGELIASEARALTRKTGGVPTPYRIARDWAARKVAEGRVVDVASRAALQRYARASAKAAKAAEAAILSGDVDDTFRQKQAQLLNHALLVEAKKAADDVDAAVARLSKIARKATMRSVDQDYLDRAHALLEPYSFRPMSEKGLQERERFQAWAAEQVANGIDVVTPPRLAGEAQHYSRISVEDLRGLKDSVDQLMHLGRHKQRLIDEKEARDYDAARDEMLGGLGNLPPLPVKPNIEPGRWGKFKDAIVGFHAALTKMGRMIFVMDGGNTNGPFHRYIWRPLANAATRENDLMADVQRRNSESLAAVPKEILRRFDERVSVPEMPGAGGDTVWSRSQLHQMARNAGTAENWRILCEGRGWEPQAAMAALDREMSREEWEYVQRDLETVGSFWPEIKALYERVNGIAPPQVEAQPIVTRHGTFPGGYYPLVPDSTANPVIERKMQSDELFNVLFTRSTTRNGFINERTGATYVVSLAPGVSQRHVMEVVHDFTHREAVMQADKFLSDPRIVTAMRETIGLEMQKQFRPWLKAVANQWAQDKTGAEAAEKIANKMRTNMSIMGMGYRISTMLQQLAGYANSIEALGTDAEKWMLSGAKSVAGMGPREAFHFASDRSGLIRHRMQQVDLTQEQELKKLQGKRGIGAEVRRFAFHGIGIMDAVVVIPTWHAGYNKAMAEGMPEEDAVAYADHVVNASQGAAGIMNAAAIQRQKGMSSLLVMFYSYGSAYYNRQAQLGRDWKGAVREGRSRDVPRLIARTWWLMLAPNLISTLIQGMLGQGPDDDESYAAWLAMGTLSGIFTGVPLVNSAVSSAIRGFGYSASPLDRAVTTVGKAAQDAWHKIDDYVPEGLPGADPGEDTEPSSRWARNGIESLGYMTGMPFGQLGTATQFVIDWANDDQDPHSVGEWLRGLQTGKAEPRH